MGLGASVALPLGQVTARSLAGPGAVAMLAGDLTAMAGTYLLLVMVLLDAMLVAFAPDGRGSTTSTLATPSASPRCSRAAGSPGS